MRNIQDLVADLHRLGVHTGDALMVHASLRRIGPVEGGADGVLDALDAAVGDEGTLMMTLGAVVLHEWVNQRPEAEREALLATEPPYDPLTAPSLPEVGWLAEVFRRRPGTFVSDNPSGRFGARGHSAEALMRDAPWHDYYGPDSPLERFVALGGRVLRMGASPDTTTLLHHAEYMAEVPNKRTVRRHYRVAGPEGPVTRAMDCLNDETGIVDSPGEDYFATILKAYLATGRARSGSVGDADSELIEGREIVEFGTRWMSRNLPQWADRG